MMEMNAVLCIHQSGHLLLAGMRHIGIEQTYVNKKSTAKGGTFFLSITFNIAIMRPHFVNWHVP